MNLNQDAKGAVTYWTDECVWFVADGKLPQKLPGWSFEPGEGIFKQSREVYVTTPDKAMGMLRYWVARKTIRFMVVPQLDMAEVHGDEDQLLPCSVPEAMSMWSSAVAENTGSVFLMVFASPKNADVLRARLVSAGLCEDPDAFIDTILRRLDDVLRFYTGKPTDEEGAMVDKQEPVVSRNK